METKGAANPAVQAPAQPFAQPNPGVTVQPGVMSAAQPQYAGGGGGQGGVWMTAPTPPPGCPPGLEYLTQIDQILVHQKVELLEMVTNIETNNRFVLKNSMGQQIFRCEEDTDFCMRYCCGKARGFVYRMYDNMNREVMNVIREFKCCAGCCWCAGCDHCAFLVRVEAPPGNVIGYTRQMASFFRIILDVKDGNEETIFKIRGPVCPCGCSDVHFPLLSADGGSELGMITKQWGGLAREMFTDADNFGISFPMDLDVKLKATLIGALMLVDMMAFQKDKNNN